MRARFQHNSNYDKFGGGLEIASDTYKKKIWIAISTPFQVNFFDSLMKKLEDRVEFIVTARDHDKIIPMLDAKGIEYFKVGKHGGRELDGKLQAYTDTIQQMLPIVKQEKPDLLLTERWPEAVRTAFGLNVPSWTLFYDEREYYVNWMTFPLSSKIFAPTFYSKEDLKEHGVTDPRKIVWFNGFHTCYLKDYSVDRITNPLKDMGLRSPIVLVRPEPDSATFFAEKTRKTLEEAVELLKKSSDADIVVFPRNEQQAKRFPESVVTVFDDVTFDCPIAHADVTLGAAETMLMESFVLGTPTVSAIYWSPAKPVIELHKYIPHSTNPKELVNETINFFDLATALRYREMTEAAVKTMDNPVDKMVDEIHKLFDPTPAPKKARRRSRMEVLTDVLQCISHESLIFSHIMAKTNVTSTRLKADLKQLMENGLAESFVGMDQRLYYKATKKGMQVRHEYNKLATDLGL